MTCVCVCACVDVVLIQVIQCYSERIEKQIAELQTKSEQQKAEASPVSVQKPFEAISP